MAQSAGALLKFTRQFPGESIAALGGGVVALVRWTEGEELPREWLKLYYGPDMDRANRALKPLADDGFDVCVIWRSATVPEFRRQLAEAIESKFKVDAIAFEGG